MCRLHRNAIGAFVQYLPRFVWSHNPSGYLTPQSCSVMRGSIADCLSNSAFSRGDVQSSALFHCETAGPGPRPPPPHPLHSPRSTHNPMSTHSTQARASHLARPHHKAHPAPRSHTPGAYLTHPAYTQTPTPSPHKPSFTSADVFAATGGFSHELSLCHLTNVEMLIH